ncbi:MAG: transporter substrate-binding domain-containing protein [Acidimicrobiia bacterium]|nr:transporter substrate-binding domain-containing protein [Acidimicrobiia bacterium]
MKTWRRLTSTMVVLSLVLVACGGGDGEEAGTANEEGSDTTTVEAAQLVAIAGSSIDFISLIPIAAWECAAEEGVEVEQRFVEDAATAIQAMQQGDAQIGTNIGVNVGVPAVEAGASIVDVVATQRPTWALAVEPSIQSFDDLEGKRIAVHGEASFTRAVSNYFADINGYEYEELIIPGSEVRAEALAQGQIDAAVIDLPDVVQLSETYPGSFEVLVTIGEEFPELIEQDIWLDRDWAEANEDQATTVVQCIVDAMRTMTNDTEYALELAVENLPDMDEQVLAELVEEYSTRDLWPADGLLTPERALSTLTFFNDVGEIEIDEPTEESLDDYFNFSYLETALQNLDG